MYTHEQLGMAAWHMFGPLLDELESIKPGSAANVIQRGLRTLQPGNPNHDILRTLLNDFPAASQPSSI